MTDLLTVLADPGMQAVLITLGSVLIGGLAASVWLLRHDKPEPREWSVLVPTEPDDRDEALRTIARHVAAHGTPPGDYMGVVAGERVELIPLDDVRDRPEVGA